MKNAKNFAKSCMHTKNKKNGFVKNVLLNLKKMNRKNFLKKLKDGFQNNLKIAKLKNSDYSIDSDAFLNFRACETLGISAEIGLIVRMTDKLTRISNLLHKKAAVKDETIADTLSDLANYAMILKIYIENKNKPLQIQ